jgi:endonuclease-3
MVERRSEEILNTLRQAYGTSSSSLGKHSPFEVLIVTVISQNTAEKNAEKAFENLSKRMKITPEVLSKSPSGEIERCLKTAGLFRRKASTIKEISKRLLENGRNDLETILSLPVEQARSRLMQFPGVGPKTADVVLLFSANRPTIPVDTHVHRVSRRLGLVATRANIEMTRKALQELFRSEDYRDVHVLLITHGRTFCKARKPKCAQCPTNHLCSARTSDRHRC